MNDYDVIVIGGGHAGAEAARAAADALGAAGGGRVALVTMDPARIGRMSCNPAIGGLAKGQMVREVDALGGIMGAAIDATGIMFKMLNTSKGPAVRGPRAQADKYAYAAEVQRRLAAIGNLDVLAGRVDDLPLEQGRVDGVILAAGAGIVRADPRAIEANAAGDRRAVPVFPAAPVDADRFDVPLRLRAAATVLTTGTFMRGLMHTGERRTAGGRVGEAAADGISAVLRRLGLELGRLKTGTPPRLDRATIDWADLERQDGDGAPVPFSDLTDRAAFPRLAQVECRLTATTPAQHELIRANLHRAPMYAGRLEASTGPRYCPSIEDKVVRFADRSSHHVFLEPESLHTREVYCNGISTSLPEDIQAELVRGLPGCARASILRFGYAVEYDMVWPHQIDATTEVKGVPGLLLAGQINCTTGYEEAAGQGVLAGVNAARLACGAAPIALGRDEAYVGVMLDDLVTRMPREPYRMFTSRAEHRLLLRADNADERLTPIGRRLGIVDDARWTAFEGRRAALDELRGALRRIVVDGRPLAALARRPDVTADEIARHLAAPAERGLLERVIVEARYAGYIDRQRAQICRHHEAERRRLPGWLDFRAIPGLRAEAAEVLSRFRPATFGQAGRLAGVNPADLTLLAVAVRRGPTTAVAGPRQRS